MSKKRVIKFTEDEIRGYLAKRHTLATLGEAHNAAKDTVSRSLLAIGCDDIKARIEENRTRGAAKLSERQIEEVVTRAKNGEHPNDFADEYDVTVCAIRYYLRKHGVIVARPKVKEWVEPKHKTIKLKKNMAGLVPRTCFTQFHSMMTRAMKA